MDADLEARYRAYLDVLNERRLDDPNTSSRTN